MKKLLSFLLFLSLIGCNNSENHKNDRLYEVFQNPPAEAKAFVRWWWNGDCVEEHEIIRELEIMKKAGIGGVEINPIAMPVHDREIHCDCHEWLSPEWNRLVKRTIEEASEREMIVDLIMGSGWPFGGRFLEKEQMIQGVGINRIKLSGPMVYSTKISEIIQAPGRYQGQYKEADPPELFFLRLVPLNASGTSDVTDVMNRVNEKGEVSIQVPEGEFELFIGSYQYGYREVSHGAPGSDGPVLDHMNEEAVQAYLDRLSEALEAVLGGELGDFVRAIFCDSIELSGSNWTGDFREEFIQRNGYDPEPWLPFIFYYPYEGYTDTLRYSEALNDSIRRARYDFNQTIIDVFLERFTHTFHNWAHDHGLLSRYQAYGNPWHVGISEGYMIPDIPESNNWLYTWDYAKEHGFWIWNKYASSSGHLTGRNIISSESMTNTRGVFEATMEIFKQNDDFNFITGINHSVLHGFNYSPPEAGFPGWIRYGAYFNENNTWWPWFHLWTNYNARLSAVFQEADAISEVAILAPFADHYAQTGLYRQPIHVKPWYAHDLWESCSQLGYNADYINENVIREAEFHEGKMKYGPMAYQLLFVAGAKSIEPETAIALNEFAKNGGRIIFIENLPFRSPSLNEFSKNDSIVNSEIKKATEYERVELIQPPEQDEEALLMWTGNILKKYDVQTPVRIMDPDTRVYQNHFKYGDQTLFFFSNQSASESRSFTAEINAPGNQVPWIWLPESGKRMLYVSKSSDELNIHLHPLESVLIVYDEEREADEYLFVDFSKFNQKKLQIPWKMTFNHMNGDRFVIQNNKLIDFSKAEDERIKTFAGNVLYEGVFTTDVTEQVYIDPGDVSGGITTLYINGEKVGTKWFGRHNYYISPWLKPGENNIKIEYVTVLANYALSLKESKAAQRWIQGEPIKQGIVGPVTLKYKN